MVLVEETEAHIHILHFQLVPALLPNPQGVVPKVYFALIVNP
jgi:hypothetical protein